MEISFSSNSITDNHIATKFGTCHDSPAVVPCAKYCSDHYIIIWMRAKWNFHHIWIVMEKLLVKWAPEQNVQHLRDILKTFLWAISDVFEYWITCMLCIWGGVWVFSWWQIINMNILHDAWEVSCNPSRGPWKSMLYWKPWLALVQVTIWCLFCTKLLPESMQANH